MGAAAADRDTRMRFGEKYSYPVAATTKIYGGTLVCLDADGNAVPAANTAGYRIVGIAAAQVDNSAGLAGALTVEVFRTRHAEITTSGATAAVVGQPVFVVNDNEVSLVNGDVIAGVVTGYVSATSVYIDLEPAISGALQPRVVALQHLVLSSIADGDAVSAVDLGIEGTITDITFVTGDKVTTASKLSTLTPSIGATALTGGVLSLTSAALNAVGKPLASSAITGKNRLRRGDTLKFVASSTTAFAEGSGTILVTLV